MRLRDAAEALREPRFAWYFAATIVRRTGASMTGVALAFAVLHVSNAPDALAGVLAVYMTANVLFVLLGGVIADRFSRVLVIQACAAASAVIQGTVAVLVITGRAEIWHLVALEGVGGAVDAFWMPASVGIVPLIVRAEHVQQANALLSFVRSTIQIAGPAVAGLLVVGVGPGWALAVDALTCLLSIPLLARVRLPARERVHAGEQGAGASMWADLREGWGEFVARTWLWVIVAVFGVLNAIHIGAEGVLGPLIAKGTPEIGEAGWGLVLSAQAIGTVISTIVLLRIRLRRPLVAGMLAISTISIPLALLALTPSTAPLAMGFLVAGACMEVFGVGWLTALQQHIPEAVLSRVSSYDALGSFVAMPIGALAYGWLATSFDRRTVLLVSAVAYAVLSLSTLALPSVRGLRQLETD